MPVGNSRRSEFHMAVEIPPNATALVTLPANQPTVITDEELSGVCVGSGIHKFHCGYAPTEEWPPHPLLGPFQRDDPEDIWTDSSGVGRLTMAELLARWSEPSSLLF